MDTSDLSSMLSKFEIAPERNAFKWGGLGQRRGYMRASFEDAWRLYGVTAQPVNTPEAVIPERRRNAGV
jgi:Protein of unknown function (DUF3631)